MKDTTKPLSRWIPWKRIRRAFKLRRDRQILEYLAYITLTMVLSTLAYKIHVHSSSSARTKDSEYLYLNYYRRFRINDTRFRRDATDKFELAALPISDSANSDSDESNTPPDSTDAKILPEKPTNYIYDSDKEMFLPASNKKQYEEADFEDQIGELVDQDSVDIMEGYKSVGDQLSKDSEILDLKKAREENSDADESNAVGAGYGDTGNVVINSDNVAGDRQNK